MHKTHSGRAKGSKKTARKSRVFLLEMGQWIPQRSPDKLARLHSGRYNITIYQLAKGAEEHFLSCISLSPLQKLMDKTQKVKKNKK